MKKVRLWCAAFIVVMMASNGSVQQTALGTDEIITKDIPHQY